jgi:hypothetical protein
MAGAPHYVRIRVDESFVNRTFKKLEDRLNEQEAMICGLHELLGNKVEQRALQAASDDLRQQLNERVEDVCSQITALEPKLQSNIQELESRFVDRLAERAQSVDTSVQQRLDVLRAELSPTESGIPICVERLQRCESELAAANRKLVMTHVYVQRIAAAFAALSNANAALDESLPDTLRGTTDLITGNFQKLFDDVANLRERQRQIETPGPAAASASPQVSWDESASGECRTSSDVSWAQPASSQESGANCASGEMNVPGGSDVPVAAPVFTGSEVPAGSALAGGADAAVSRAPNASHGGLAAPMSFGPGRPLGRGTMRDMLSVIAPSRSMLGRDAWQALQTSAHWMEQSPSVVENVNFTDFKPSPAAKADWLDEPDLPVIRQFHNIRDFVEYFYRLMPKLQAHLTAIQGKVVELDRCCQDKIERGLVEKMFDKFQYIIAEFTKRVEALRQNLEETATRDEINGLLENLLSSLHSRSETAVGQVRCIVCHREMMKVTGAVPEQDAGRAQGDPPNSIVVHSKGASAGVSYSSRQGFDSVITESPKSKSPVKPTAIRPRVK